MIENVTVADVYRARIERVEELADAEEAELLGQLRGLGYIE